jgi:hypothetical protein
VTTTTNSALWTLVVHGVIGLAVIGALAALAAVGVITGEVAVGGILGIAGVLLGTSSSAVGALGPSTTTVTTPVAATPVPTAVPLASTTQLAS